MEHESVRHSNGLFGSVELTGQLQLGIRLHGQTVVEFGVLRLFLDVLLVQVDLAAVSVEVPAHELPEVFDHGLHRFPELLQQVVGLLKAHRLCPHEHLLRPELESHLQVAQQRGNAEVVNEAHLPVEGKAEARRTLKPLHGFDFPNSRSQLGYCCLIFALNLVFCFLLFLHCEVFRVEEVRVPEPLLNEAVQFQLGRNRLNCL